MQTLSRWLHKLFYTIIYLIVDAAQDRRILWSYTNEGIGGTMELVGAGWSWLELARSWQETDRSGPSRQIYFRSVGFDMAGIVSENTVFNDIKYIL